MNIITPQTLPVSPAQPAVDVQVLKPPPIAKIGAILEAVVSGYDKKTGYQLLLNGHQVKAESGQALPLGSRIALQVTGADSSGQITARLINPQNQQLMEALQARLPVQTQPGALFRALLSPEISNHLPNTVRAMLKALPSRADLSTGSGIQEAFLKSGLHLESILGKFSAADSGDLKLLLLKLLRASKQLQSGSAKPEAFKEEIRQTSSKTPVSAQDLLAARQEAPITKAYTANQNIQHKPLQLGQASDDPGLMIDKPEKLSQGLNQAIARIESQQLLHVQAKDNQTLQWLFDIPVMNGGKIDIWNICIREETRRKAEDTDREPKWSVSLSVDLEKLGCISIRIDMTPHWTRFSFYCDESSTLQQLKGHVSDFRQRLEQLGFPALEFRIERGKLPEHYQPDVSFSGLDTRA